MSQKSGRQTKPANFGTFWPIFQDPVHIFQNQFLRWNRELKPVILSTMNPINGTNFFLSYKGGCRFLKSRTPQLKPLKIENFNDFPKTYIIYPNNYYQPNWKCDFLNFQPTLLDSSVGGWIESELSKIIQNLSTLYFLSTLFFWSSLVLALK